MYYASEICPIAKAIVENKQDLTIYQKIGNVEKVLSKLHEYGKIDLLCASPPCNKLSKINPEREKLQGNKSKIISITLYELKSLNFRQHGKTKRNVRITAIYSIFFWHQKLFRKKIPNFLDLWECDIDEKKVMHYISRSNHPLIKTKNNSYISNCSLKKNFEIL